MPGAAHGARDHSVGLRTVNELFSVRVPDHLPPQQQSDIAYVTERSRLVTRLYGRHRVLACLDCL